MKRNVAGEAQKPESRREGEENVKISAKIA